MHSTSVSGTPIPWDSSQPRASCSVLIDNPDLKPCCQEEVFLIQQRLLPTDTCPGPSAVERDRQEVGSSWRCASGEARASGDIGQNGICLQFMPCLWVCLTSVIDTDRGAEM